MAKLTHRVLYSDLGCPLNLRDMAETKIDIEYHSLSFERLLWRHRKIGCTYMIYSTGKIICHGGKEQTRQYARLVERMGYPVRMKKIKTLTMSAVYTLRGKVDYCKIVQWMQGSYEPEIFHAVGFIREGIHYTIYKSGKTIVTGIKSEKDLDNKVNAVLLELEVL